MEVPLVIQPLDCVSVGTAVQEPHHKTYFLPLDDQVLEARRLSIVLLSVTILQLSALPCQACG